MKRTLLGIFAHPDDESFGPGGSLARCAAEGIEVHVLTTTDGAAGKVDPALIEGLPGADDGVRLAGLRSQELEAACLALGAGSHRLTYRDSGMAGSPDNQNPDCLIQADRQAVAEDIAAFIDRLQPQVVVTHDPTGGYFHPDHIRTYEAVNLAFDLVETRPESWRPLRLFYTVIPRKFIRRAMWIIRLSGKNPKRFGENKDIDLSKLGEPEEGIHLRLDVSAHHDAKAAASACHVSQGGGGLPRFIPAPLRRRMTRFEYFALARPAASPGDRVKGFFEDIES